MDASSREEPAEEEEQVGWRSSCDSRAGRAHSLPAPRCQATCTREDQPCIANVALLAHRRCRRHRRRAPHPSSPCASQVALAVALSRQRKNQQKEAGKASIAKGAQPLKVKPPEPAAPAGRVFRQAWRRTAGELSEVEQRTAVLQVGPQWQ